MSNAAAISAMTIAGLVGIIGSYAVGYIDTKLGTKKACMIYCGIFALGILFNLLAEFCFPLVYVSIFIVGFSLGGSTNMSLSFPASVFGRTGLSEGKRRDLPDQLLHRMSELRRKRCRHESDGKPDGRICGISVPVPCKHPDRIQDRRRKMG